MLRQDTAVPVSSSGVSRPPLAELQLNGLPLGPDRNVPPLKTSQSPARCFASVARGRERGTASEPSSLTTTGQPRRLFLGGVPAQRLSWGRPCVTEAVKVLPDASAESLLSRLSAADRDDLLLLAAGVCVLCAVVCSGTLVCSRLLHGLLPSLVPSRPIGVSSGPLFLRELGGGELLQLSGGEVRVNALLRHVVRSLLLAPVRLMRGPLKAVLLLVRWLLTVSEE